MGKDSANFSKRAFGVYLPGLAHSNQRLVAVCTQRGVRVVPNHWCGLYPTVVAEYIQGDLRNMSIGCLRSVTIVRVGTTTGNSSLYATRVADCAERDYGTVHIAVVDFIDQRDGTLPTGGVDI
jgi:hypothetical protein